ncbi:MAG: hypothetical protein LIO56_00355 [Lachnospiraceae bacterium]|nr:hypothetical protein [Lachnospiraceae bacterium]
MKTIRLLRQADLVVITIRQNYRDFCRLFLCSRNSFSNCVYLVLDYVPDDSINLKRIAFEFRIPSSRLACIPYSPRIKETKKWPDTGPFSPDIRRELNRAGQIILLALGF